MRARVYFGRCPNRHFVLLDKESPSFQHNSPTEPLKTVCLGCGPQAVVELRQIWQGEVSLEDRDRGFMLAPPVLIADPEVAIKKNQPRAKAEAPCVEMATVRCDQCGEEFWIAHNTLFQDPDRAKVQAQWLEETLAEEHRRNQTHPDAIALP